MSPDKSKIAVGLLFMAVSVMPLLAAMGILPSGSVSSDPAPSWAGWIVGLMFAASGILIIIQAFTRSSADGSPPVNEPGLVRGVYNVLSIAVVCALGALMTWVAFGPGSRHFSIGIGIAGLWISGAAANNIIGRIGFGLVAVLVWLFLAIFLVISIRRWRR